MTADRYLDIGVGLLPGTYRVALMRGYVCHGQALFETATDCAACAALMGLPVLSGDEAIVAACKALGVATAVPPGSTGSDAAVRRRHANRPD